MELYNKFRNVPAEAKKTITAGRLKGFTDINPMWRIKVLTEQFGACGIGWYTEIVEKQLVKNDETKEVCAFVKINLYVKVDGEWSKPITGLGGSKLAANERSGLYVSDECFKMAYTDAISIACKSLGIAADVYYEKDRTKYTTAEDEKPQQKSIEQMNNEVIDSTKVSTLRKCLAEKNIAEQAVLDRYGVRSIEEMTLLIWNKAMKAVSAS